MITVGDALDGADGVHQCDKNGEREGMSVESSEGRGILNQPTATFVQNKDGSDRRVPLIEVGLTFPAVAGGTDIFIAGVSIDGSLTSEGEIELPDADLIHLGYGGLEHIRRPGDQLVSVEATLIIHRVSFGYQGQEGIQGASTVR